MIVTFWIALSVVVYSYVGFPMIVVVRGRLRRRPWSPSPSPRTNPAVTVVIAAYNEGQTIGPKLETVVAQAYAGSLDCVVISDGSDDQTVAVARGFTGRLPLLVIDGPRMGKAKALNRALENVTGEIIVFTDANSALAFDAVARLVEPFADIEVGGVAGDQRYIGTGGDAVGERSYWSLDRVLKIAESDAGNVISATGALYAIRRELAIQVPDGVTDDFVVSTGVIDQGHRLVFASDAVAYEPTSSGLGREYQRKVRVMTRGLRAVLFRRRLLDPRVSGFYAVQLISHKVIRRLSVIPLIVSMLAASLLGRHPGYRLVAWSSRLAAVAIVAGSVLAKTRWSGHRVVAFASYFGMVNVAALHALWNVVSGRRINRWTPGRQEGAGP